MTNKEMARYIARIAFGLGIVLMITATLSNGEIPMWVAALGGFLTAIGGNGWK